MRVKADDSQGMREQEGVIKTCSDQNVPFSVLVAVRMLGCGIHSILDNYSAEGDSILPLLAFFTLRCCHD